MLCKLPLLSGTYHRRTSSPEVCSKGRSHRVIMSPQFNPACLEGARLPTGLWFSRSLERNFWEPEPTSVQLDKQLQVGDSVQSSLSPPTWSPTPLYFISPSHPPIVPSSGSVECPFWPSPLIRGPHVLSISLCLSQKNFLQ